MHMKKFIFVSALVVMGFACVGCTTTDNTNTAPMETTTPATDNMNGTMNNGTTVDGTTMNGTTTNGTTTNGTTMNETTTNGTTMNETTTNKTTMTEKAMDGTTMNDTMNRSTDDAANGVVTDTNGIINDGTTNTKK